MDNSLIYQKVEGCKERRDIYQLKESNKIDLTKILLWGIMISNVLFITLIILSLFFKSSLRDVGTVIKDLNTLKAIKITISSIICSAVMTIIIGVPFAYVMAQKQGKIYRIINMILNLPLVMPPTVAGLALLMAFGRRGAFAKVIRVVGLDIPFSFVALIIVQVFVMLPLFTQALRSGFEAIDQDIKEAAMVFGAGEKELLFFIYLPLSIRTFVTGLIMACLRAAGEFGATMMFAGNLSGKTQTLSTAIYTLSQKDLGQSISLAVVLILIFLIPLLILELKLKD
ncbi:molybdate ABC transporter permease subunit [Orenia marismortui]|uniref:Molybdate transport system permease protein n=1 Tax=Orenia marismortui TaxID=46469 RepID=A0A4R8H9F7_9FIRM|nr:ABC transporter permease subunit [Orenia marismortui]TDX52707.1 molybdate transport system permease protein [Orenia marismortui]